MRPLAATIAKSVLLSSLVLACSSNDAAKTTGNTITREPVDDSVFKAAELERVIDAFVAEFEDASPESLKHSVIVKEHNAYWQPVEVGASRAMAELGITGEPTATEEHAGDVAVEQQVALLNSEVKSGADGVVIAPFETALQTPIDDAVDKGVPVVTIDSDLTASNRDYYVGTLNEEAGMISGSTLVDLLPSGEGTVIILGKNETDWPDGYDRTMGAKTAIEDAGYNVIVRTTDWDTGGEEADIAFMLDTLAIADPPVVGMIGLFSDAYRCAMALEQAGKAPGDVPVAAFDFEDATVAYMRSGRIQVTHAQRQYYMGYMAPYILYGITVLGRDKTSEILSPVMYDMNRVYSGLDIVTSDQLDDYSDFLEKLGVSSN